jgi:hypothetical protein
MHAFLNHSSRCLYKNYIQIGRLLRNRRGFRDRVLHLQLSPTLSRKYIQINTWAFPYWPGYYPETPILARDEVEDQYGSRDNNQANMEMPMY